MSIMRFLLKTTRGFYKRTKGVAQKTDSKFYSIVVQQPRLETKILFSEQHAFIHMFSKAAANELNILNQDYFNRLKAEEKKQFGNVLKRNRTGFEKNLTAAMALPYTTEQLVAYSKDERAFVTLCKDQIIEHANRRVDLFFYTMIAYYKTNSPPTLGTVHLQHGKGRSAANSLAMTAGCHTSFLPSFVDKTIYQNRKTGQKYRCILSNTHFMDSLNSTIELPVAANRFDFLLENPLGCRKKSLEILCHVAMGYYNPIDGLTIFLKIMEQILTEHKPNKTKDRRHQFFSKHPIFSQLNIPAELITFMAQGTLETTFDAQTQMTSRTYIESLLRIPDQKRRKGLVSDNELLEQMTELQLELLTPKSTK